MTGNKGRIVRPASDKQAEAAVSDFVRQLGRMGGAFSPRDLFRDFVEMTYFAYAKLSALAFDDPARADALEERYMRAVRRYPEQHWDSTIRRFPELVALASEHCSFEYDFLGRAAAELGGLNEGAGQFFTPMSVARAMAQMTYGTDDMERVIATKGFVSVSDDACGSGNLLLGFAGHMQNAGYHVQQHLLAHGRDVSFTAYCMAFLQLNWTGVPALVEHGDSLRMTSQEQAWTLGAVMFAHCNGHLDFSATTDASKRRTVDAVMTEWGFPPPAALDNDTVRDMSELVALMKQVDDLLQQAASAPKPEPRRKGKIITFRQKETARAVLQQAVGDDGLALRMMDEPDATVEALDAEIVDAAQRQLTLF